MVIFSGPECEHFSHIQAKSRVQPGSPEGHFAVMSGFGDAAARVVVGDGAKCLWRCRCLRRYSLVMDTNRDMRNVGPVELALHASLVPTGVEDQLVAISAGPNGEAIALWATVAGAEAMRGRTVSPGFASFPDPRTERPVSARVRVYHPSPVRDVAINGLENGYPLVQPLPDDRTLIVGARCRWHADGPERNAIVVDADGGLVADGTLGDGIEEVLATRSGRIWVGYFDEGVFGNFGWGGPGPEPIGSPGIICFASDLVAAWRYPYDADGGSIADAYSLNVDGETAWSSYYTDFPIVRIRSDVITTWRGGPSGTRALIVDDDRCALIGGYGADRNRVLVGSLTSEGFVPDRVGVLTLPDGTELGHCRIVARGAELHVFVESRWYKLAVADIGN